MKEKMKTWYVKIWFPERQENKSLTRVIVLVIDNAVRDKLQFNFLQAVTTQCNSHEHDYSIHCTIFFATYHLLPSLFLILQMFYQEFSTL